MSTLSRIEHNGCRKNLPTTLPTPKGSGALCLFPPEQADGSVHQQRNSTPHTADSFENSGKPDKTLMGAVLLYSPAFQRLPSSVTAMQETWSETWAMLVILAVHQVRYLPHTLARGERQSSGTTLVISHGSSEIIDLLPGSVTNQLLPEVGRNLVRMPPPQRQRAA